MTEGTDAAAADTGATDALVERLFEATIGTLELFGVHLGWRLGLYSALAEGGPATPGQLALRAGIDERYATEWLEQQSVAGILEVEDPAAGATVRRYALPEAHVAVLVDPDSPAFVAPFAPMVVGIAGALPEVVEAYRTGAGVPYTSFGADFRDGQGAINRPAYLHDLAGWIAQMPSVDARLRAQPPARVADVGCGQGFSTTALAAAYPNARVVGVDADAASVEDAARAAAAAGADVEFVLQDGTTLAGGPYDLVCVFEALHDMSDPVGALRAARAALAPDGAVLVVDERVAHAFTAPGDPVERAMYGWSISHCLPASRAEQPSAALGTVLRAGTVRELAADAGFADLDELPIAHDFFRFYLMRG